VHNAAMPASKPGSPLRRLLKFIAVAACATLTQLCFMTWPATPAKAAVCTFDAAPSVAFGTYDITNASPTDSVGTINISCDKNPGGIAKLSAGSGTFAQRTMLNGANVLYYNLFTTSALTKVWGDGSAGTGTVSFKTTANSLPVYGRIPALQSVQPGLYSDSIVVTISF
jgi:spore coat protein U-like protein